MFPLANQWSSWRNLPLCSQEFVEVLPSKYNSNSYLSELKYKRKCWQVEEKRTSSKACVVQIETMPHFPALVLMELIRIFSTKWHWFFSWHPLQSDALSTQNSSILRCYILKTKKNTLLDKWNLLGPESTIFYTE